MQQQFLDKFEDWKIFIPTENTLIQLSGHNYKNKLSILLCIFEWKQFNVNIAQFEGNQVLL